MAVRSPTYRQHTSASGDLSLITLTARRLTRTPNIPERLPDGGDLPANCVNHLTQFKPLGNCVR